MQGKVEELFNQIKTMDFVKRMNDIVADINRNQRRDDDDGNYNFAGRSDDPEL